MSIHTAHAGKAGAGVVAKWMWAVLVASLALPPAASGAVFWVADPGQSIQERLDRCVDGDAVFVRWSVDPYRENLKVPAGVKLIGEPAFNPNRARPLIVPADPLIPTIRLLTVRGSLSDTQVEQLSLREGGSHAIRVEGNGRCAILNNEIFGNQGMNGAGIYCEGPAGLRLVSNYINGNAAAKSGGAVYLSGQAALDGQDNRYGMNSAGVYGGAICINGSRGACNVLLSGEELDGNQAASGGGIAVIKNQGTVRIERGHLLGNSATGDGGGLYAMYTQVRANAVPIEGNRAGRNGGGVHAQSSLLTITQAAMDQNVASARGGGIHASGSLVYLLDSTLCFNRAMYGGGAYLRAVTAEQLDLWGGKRRPEIRRNTFFKNIASYRGGALAADAMADFYVANNVLERNEAVQGHGIFFGEGGQVRIYNNTFAHYYNFPVHLSSWPEAIRIAGQQTQGMAYNNVIVGHRIGMIGPGNAGWNDFRRVTDCLIQTRDAGQNRWNADPLFVLFDCNRIPPNDLHLTARSPARNSASPVFAPSEDRDGQMRDSMPDRGAYEFLIP